MDPLITNGIDPTLRTMEKQGHDRELPSRRKRPVVREKTAEQAAQQAEDDINQELDPDTPKHLLDDLL